VGEESPEADEGVPGVVAKLKCLRGANIHPCPLGIQLGSIGQVGCQQETNKDPHQVGEGAVWVAEVSPVAAQDGAEADVKLRLTDKGPGPQWGAWPHLGCQQETKKAPHQDGAGADLVGEESPKADKGGPGVGAKLK